MNTTIVSTSPGQCGIGHGGDDALIRAEAESLERFWLSIGPSAKAEYFLPAEKQSELNFQDLFHLRGERSDHYKIDSSGTAIHASRGAALESAALEFIERQSLIAHWALGTPGIRVELSNQFAPALRGIVETRSISLFGGIHVHLSLLSSESNSVQYAAGAAASRDKDEATFKSLRELSQAHLAMQDNVARRSQGRSPMDAIQENYLRSNSARTSTQWPNLAEAAPLLFNEFADPVRAVFETPIPPSLCIDRLDFAGKPLFISRFASPKWFLGLTDTNRGVPEAFREFGLERINNQEVPFG